MDTTILELAAAVVAMKPRAAPEYCLLWIERSPMCMSPGEWAAWAQAFFSVLAIAVAIYLPRRDAKARRRQAEVQVVMSMLALSTWIRKLTADCDDHELEEVRMGGFAVQEVLESLRGTSLDALEADAAFRVVAVRSIARRIGHVLAKIEAIRPPTPEIFNAAKAELGYCLSEIRRHITESKLRISLPDEESAGTWR